MRGFFDLIGGWPGLALYVFLAVCASYAHFHFDVYSAASFLSLPLVLGLAIFAGLLFRLVGAIAATSIVFTVTAYAYFVKGGRFLLLESSESLLLCVGLVASVGAFSFGSSLLMGLSRRSAEVAMYREHLLSKIFDALPIGIWVRARDGRTLFVNERWAGFSTLSVEEIMASKSLKPPVDLGEKWLKQVEEILREDDTAVRYQPIDLVDADGQQSSLTLLTLCMFIEQENDFGTLSLLVDETALRLYEERVRESEQNLDVALNNARMGFWDENLKDHFVICDQNWFDLIGETRDPSVSPLQVWKDRLHPDDRNRVRDLYRDYYRSGEGSFRVEYRIRKGDDKYIWVRDNVRIMEYDTNGSPQRVVGTMQEITEQKNSELELKSAMEQAELGNEMKSQFIATVSHEIRTPLNAIIGLSSLLLEGELNPEDEDLARTIYSSGQSLMYLVSDILDFSRIEAGHLDFELQEFPIELCFQDCLKLFRAKAIEKDVELVLNVSDELTEFALGDMERLRQVLQNLVSNAVKFTRAGQVAVSVEPVLLSHLNEVNRPDPSCAFGYLDEPDHQYLQVKVKDTGIGIPKHRQHVLFEAFSQVDASATREFGGTGLGLAICKRLTEAMGGGIWFDSVEGEGTTFTFVIRVKFLENQSGLQSATSSPPEKVERIASEHPCDILVVGPDTATKRVLAVCRELGYMPHQTEDYTLSGEIFNRRYYHLVLVWMENEQTTLQLVRQLTNASQLVRPGSIVGLSDPEKNISVDRCRLGGLSQVVQEAIRPDSIREVILDALGVRD